MGYQLQGTLDLSGPSNPMHTTATASPGAWLVNFSRYPWMWAGPAMGALGIITAMIGIALGLEPVAFGGSSIASFGIISTVGLSMFPFILPSSIDPHSSLTVWNASSSHMTLFIMLVVTIIFLPIVLAYTSWVYAVLFGRSTEAELVTNPDLY